MAKKYLDDTGMTYFWGKLKDYFQAKLVSGTNIKTINSESVLGSGDISLIDIFYPVGSYYETSDTSFDPNTSWGGTWSLEAEGQVHVSAGSTYTSGSSYGADTHTHTTGDVTLTTNQIPSHTHTYAKPNANTGGTAITKAQLPKIQLRVGQNMSSLGVSGTWYLTYDTVQTQGAQASARLSSSANGAWAYTETLGSGNTHTHTQPTTSTASGSAGGGAAHNHGSTGSTTRNSWQPSIAVNRWHRTA